MVTNEVYVAAYTHVDKSGQGTRLRLKTAGGIIAENLDVFEVQCVDFWVVVTI